MEAWGLRVGVLTFPSPPDRNPQMTSCHTYTILLLSSLGLLTLGCATPQQHQTRTAWKVLCEDAPYGTGSSISAKAQRAMSRVGAWQMSVEEMNHRCQSLRH